MNILYTSNNTKPGRTCQIIIDIYFTCSNLTNNYKKKGDTMHNSVTRYFITLRNICDKIGAKELGSYVEFTGDDYVRFQLLFLQEHETVNLEISLEDMDGMEEEDLETFLVMQYHGILSGQVSVMQH